MSLTLPPIVYKPEWNPNSNIFENICHFEKHKTGNKYVCHCRNNEDTFKNLTEYKQHINHKYHEVWVKGYGKYANEEIKKLTEENKQLLKENAILNGTNWGHAPIRLIHQRPQKRKFQLVNLNRALLRIYSQG